MSYPSTSGRRPLKGTLSWSDSRDMHITVGIDRLALEGASVAMLSCVGYANEVKALRAAFASGVTGPIRLRGPEACKLKAMKGTEEVHLDMAFALHGGRRYWGESVRLGYDVLHAVFIARQPGLMLEDTDDALWAQLKDSRHTTPILKGWLPHLRRELARAGKLVHCTCVDCDCMVLTATTQDLDQVVEHGIRNGLIHIAEEQVA